MKLDGVWIGDFDRMVFIEQPTKTRDSVSGQETVSAWTEFKRVWANRMQDSKESFEVQKQVANDIGKFAIRYTAGITEEMRVNDKGEYHYILGIKTVDRNSFLVLTTEKRDG